MRSLRVFQVVVRVDGTRRLSVLKVLGFKNKAMDVNPSEPQRGGR
ncbi:hypothetical protein Pan97_44720 [Bremerella volcania]|uniref:Uncharacterized protein n=1 Tax=Bremerella volcania TaxID=2527984 RepID=A0A518CDW1_9BACT|nr:hypothetical protein Pan97_44720 [Bremerella volcania]